MKNKKINDKCTMVNDKSNKGTSEKRPNLWFRYLTTTAFIILVTLLVFFLLKPLRIYSAKNFLASGDKYLASKMYLHADLEYQKALALSPRNKEVINRRELVEKSSKDVLHLEKIYESDEFYAERKKMEEATSFPPSQSDAVKLAKRLIEEKEYQLAIIPAKTATEMDPEYRDAWIYLGIANFKTAQLVELNFSTQEKYLANAKFALEKAKKIDPESKVVNDYLESIN